MAATKTAKDRTSRNDTPDTPKVRESKIARMKVDELRRELSKRGVKGIEGLKKPELVDKLIKAEVRLAKGRRKKPTSRNDTPDTPGVSESKIARMKASELRTRLERRGVKGTADMKKPELVERFISAERKSAKGDRRARTGGNDTPDTPEVSESRIARMKVDELRARLKREGIGDTAGLKKPELVKKLVKSLTGKGAGNGTRTAPGGRRTRNNASASPERPQVITSVADRPERDGRSLLTTDHEVIRQWARARRAVPCTVAAGDTGGGHDALQLNLPGWYSNDRRVEVSWEQWFDVFDTRRLSFAYQERRLGGELSRDFRLLGSDEEG